MSNPCTLAAAAPFRIPKEEWRSLVTSSVYRLLNLREDKLPKAKRQAHDVCPGGTAATAVRNDPASARLLFIDSLRSRVVTSISSHNCFEAAIAGAQDTVLDCAASASASAVGCCFSRSTLELKQLTIYGNSSKGQRTESTHIVTAGWATFAQALMVVGNLHEWLDEAVAAELPAATRCATTEQIHALADSKGFSKYRSTVRYAAACLSKSVSLL